jgi:hypothetical protein
MAKKKIEIEKIGSSIAIRVERNDGSYSENSFYPVANIRSVEPTVQINIAPVQADNNRLNNYPYADKLQILLKFVSDNETSEYFDIQDVSNQPTWTANLAGIAIALTDINDWLEQTISIVPIPPTSSLALPDVIDLSAEIFPYTFPSGVYTSATIIVPSGETIEINGFEYEGGAYGFSSENSFLDSFILDNPSGTGCSILVLGEVIIS